MNKQSGNNSIIIGIDIRNIGKKRTGDEVVFLNLVKQYVVLTENNSDFQHWQFKLFTDIQDKENLKKIKQQLGIAGKNNFEIISLKSSNKFIWNIWTLPRYLRKNLINIYHTQYITPFFIPRQIKIVSHIHDLSFKVYRQFIKKRDLFFLNFLIPFSLRRADKIIAVSQFTSKEIKKYYPSVKDKITVVWNASNLIKKEKLEEIKQAKEKIRQKYNLPLRYILYIGTLQPRKNLITLIQAYLKIKNKIGNLKLVIAGNTQAYNLDQKLQPYIQQFIQRKVNLSSSGSIIYFPGYIEEEDKMKIIASSEMFIYPSFYEGFGIPLLEAMSAGVPVLASNISPHREVGEEAIEYFSPQNIDELSKKMYNIYIDKNLQQKLREKELERVKNFSWRKSAQKMLGVYKELV